MMAQAQWDDMKEKMQAIKNAYTSRHYTQCAKHGEQLLASVQSDIHPIHLAYLNFYTALSHDTLAREATLKNRFKELTLAEKHYMAAIAALTPPRPDTASPTLSTSPSSPMSIFSMDFPLQGRRVSNAGSFDSSTSAASSTTSFHTDTDPDMEYSPKGLGRFSFPAPPRSTSPTKTRLSCISTASLRPQSPSEQHLAHETASFTSLLCTHLRNVQALKDKTSVPSVRFTLPSPRPSPTVAKRCSTWLESESHDPMEGVRRERKERVWRKRFDPDITRRLCDEALGELV